MRDQSGAIMQRYRSFSRYLKETFGERVQRIVLDGGFTCPNRDGSKAWGGCTYCDAHGSGPGPEARALPIREQVARSIARASKAHRPAQKFLAYFQAYTNTYAPLERLRSLYAEALEHPDVVGLCISTRPDCVPEPVLDLLEEFAGRTHLWLEMGLQSASDETLRRIRRAHTVDEFTDAVLRAHRRGLRVSSHVIFGLPGETREMMMRTVDLLAALRLEGVKFHSLYLVPGTRMADEVREGEIPMLTQDEYASLVADALERLPPETVIHRLTGDPPPGIPADPPWTRDKETTLRKIVAELERRGTMQGSRYEVTT